MRISIGGDHAGFELKERVKTLLEQRQDRVTDMGTSSAESVDYPDYAAAVAQAVSSGELDRGVLVCGTGIGMSIAANKFTNVRAALCYDVETARLSRQHNDANVLAIGSRVLDPELALTIVQKWMNTTFEGADTLVASRRLRLWKGTPDSPFERD